MSSFSTGGKASLFVISARLAAFTFLTLIVTLSLFALWFDRTFSGELRAVLDHRPPVITIVDEKGRLLAKRGVRDREIPLAKIPQFLIDAVISTEDRRFFSHFGVDPRGLARAIWNNLARGRLREGGSTITQQLVKNVFLTRKRTLTRKFRELIISFWLETHYSKRRILEYYFNRVYFGAGASHGVEAAAQRYFNKSAEDLDLSQSAMLAGLLKAPSWYSPRKNLTRAQQRADVVLDNMLETGAITPAQAQQAAAHPARPVGRKTNPRKIVGTEYAIDRIMTELHHSIGPIETDLIVKTTLNFDWQVRAQALVARMIAQNRFSKNIDQAAAVMMDESGGIKLMVGGASYAESRFNRITMAHRQPGSTFKPIVYLAALENGLSANSIVMDRRIKISGWHPRNYARFHRGPVTLRTALARSINAVAAALADDVGLDRVIATAKRLGIHSRLNKFPALALGSSEVTPLEITGAYVSFMNGGFRATPHIIAEVTTPSGEVLHAFSSGHRKRIIDQTYIYDMNDMLGAVVRSGTGKRARLGAHAVAGKTGTTQGYRDAWFIGYTGYFTCGVWAGNDDNSPTNKVSGGKLPAELWKQIMQMTHAGLKPRPLPGLGSGPDNTAQAIILAEQLPQEDIRVREENIIPAGILANNDNDR